MTPPRVAFTTPDTPFLPALARAWLDEARNAGRDPADGLLLLPTRRAARAAAAAFLDANGGALVMPRIAALGAPDEAALGIMAGLDLPPAIPAEERRATLARLILRMGGADGAPTGLSAALLLADDLALLIDAAAQAEIDLAETLPGIVAPELAAHWQRTLDFLSIVTRGWPAILAERGALDPAHRQRLLLDAQAARWQGAPPSEPVWLAGLATATPAIARLARVVAGLDRGLVVMAGFDPDLPEPVRDTLADTPAHPQAGLSRLLAAIGARWDEVTPLGEERPPGRAARVALLRRAFLPSLRPDAVDAPQVAPDPTGLWRLDAADEQDEARAIALALREALETPDRDAALVTPDRALAMRVAAELERLGIRAEDSAGERLADTPPAILLRLLAAAAASDYDAVPLLALLKHPLARAGFAPGRCRELARRLELLLRAALPGPGFTAMRFAADRAKPRDEELTGFLADLQVRLRPLGMPDRVAPGALLRGLIEAAEQIADELWTGEAGAALSEHLSVQLPALDGLPDVAPAELVPLLDAVLGGARLRRPRARDANPRIAIWGMMEARLQRVDTLVLGGLVEGVFPAEPDPGPWLSRPMRRAAQLPEDAALIGEAAHDLTSLIGACDTVICSAPRRRDRAPAVPSRFLARIELALRGAGFALPLHPATHWSAQLDQPGAEQRIQRPRPAPRPPAAARPTTYSISKITTLLADPYALYAGDVLRLRPLNELEAETDAALFGTIVHDTLKQVAREPGWALAVDAATKLAAAFEEMLRGRRLRRALEAFWLVRLERIAEWIVAIERERIAAHGPADMIRVEHDGEWHFDRFTVKGRADRLEQRRDALAIIDYKTGTPPDDRTVEAGSAPQLPIEAVIAEAGGFPGFAGAVTELAYWKLSGGATKGETRALLDGAADRLEAVIEAARTQIPALLAHYADPATPFLDAPHPSRRPADQPFAGISRRAEWQEES